MNSENFVAFNLSERIQLIGGTWYGGEMKKGLLDVYKRQVYGLIAIGYTMVYGIIGMINFAHGEVYMVSAYLCAIGLAPVSYTHLSPAWW